MGSISLTKVIAVGLFSIALIAGVYFGVTWVVNTIRDQDKQITTLSDNNTVLTKTAENNKKALDDEHAIRIALEAQVADDQVKIKEIANRKPERIIQKIFVSTPVTPDENIISAVLRNTIECLRNGYDTEQCNTVH